MDCQSQPIDPGLDGLIQYTMVFLSPGSDEKGPGLLPAGSGTFVEIAGLKGILTAGHVLKALYDLKETEFKIGVLSSDRSAIVGIPADRMLCRPFILMAEPVTEQGPDIGFLALPGVTIESILTNCNFHNLDQRIANLGDFQLPAGLRPVVVGVPTVLSENKDVSEKSRTDQHEILQLVGNISDHVRGPEGHETFIFRPNPITAGTPINDFRGVSGGGAWVVGGDEGLASRLLYGVSFFQSELSGPQRHLVCHGPASIYEKLRAEVASNKPSSL